MAGYQTIEALRPILHRGPPVAPVVNRELVRPNGREPKTWSRGKPIPPHVIAEIIARRQEGQGYNRIVRELGVSIGSVQRHAGHVLPPPGGWPDCWTSGARHRVILNKPFAARLRRAGFTYAEVGEEIGCSADAVSRLLNPGKRGPGGKAPVSDTIRHISIVSGFSRQQLRKVDGVSRKNDGLAKARHIAFWLLRTYRTLSFPIIGKSLGGFDHTTVMSGFGKANRAARKIGVTKEWKPRTAARALWAAQW